MLYNRSSETNWKVLGLRERLLRRIVSRLYTSGVIDSSQNVIEAGLAAGDNALPWASLLMSMRKPGAPAGTVFGIDPMVRNCVNTLRLARVNALPNVCVLRGALSNANGTVRVKQRRYRRQTAFAPTVTLDSLPMLTNVGLLHLDVEGYEERTLQAAQQLVKTSMPFILTERHDGDKFDDDLLLRHGYTVVTIPEVCGPNLSCRNRLWLPRQQRARAMAAIQPILDLPLQPEYIQNRR